MNYEKYIITHMFIQGFARNLLPFKTTAPRLSIMHVILAVAVRTALLKHLGANIIMCHHGREPLSCVLSPKLHPGPYHGYTHFTLLLEMAVGMWFWLWERPL